MLLGYGGRNCWCFKEWIDINLRLNGHVPEKFSSNKSFSLITGFLVPTHQGKPMLLKFMHSYPISLQTVFPVLKNLPSFTTVSSIIRIIQNFTSNLRITIILNIDMN